MTVGMRASYRDRASATNWSMWGTGSVRERSPVYGKCVVVGFDAARSRSIQHSFTVNGDAALARNVCWELVAGYGLTCAEVTHAASAGDGRRAAGGLSWQHPVAEAGHRRLPPSCRLDPLNDPLCHCAAM